jgi:DNA-binding IclR family transcriptional regulator
MATVVPGIDGQTAVGVISIAGPSLQLTDNRMNELAAPLKAAAVELSALTGAIASDINSRKSNSDEAATA